MAVPAKGVVACSWPEGVATTPAGLEEALTFGRRAAAALGTELTWLAVGPGTENMRSMAASYGVAVLRRLEDPKLECFAADALVEALAQALCGKPPRLLLLPQSFESRLLAARLALRLDAAVVMNGLELERGGEGQLRVQAAAYGGDTRMVYEIAGARTCIVGIAASAVEAEPIEGGGPAPRMERVVVDLGGVEERVQVLEKSGTSGPRLEEAQVIVAGGRGLGTRENFRLVEDLAQALGGMAGASRPIVDAGWADSSRQVGLTGKITRPALYLAAGISGASQHMVGCSAAKTLVAINNDPEASIFRYAHYGIVADCVELLPELIRAAKGK